MTILATVAFTLCVLDLAAAIVACSRPPVRRPAPTPLPRPATYDLYPQARHRNTNDEPTVPLAKLQLMGAQK